MDPRLLKPTEGIHCRPLALEVFEAIEDLAGGLGSTAVGCWRALLRSLRLQIETLLPRILWNDGYQ